MIQKGVRRFLRMLYLRRRKEAAKLIIRCLQSMQHDSAIKKSFQKLIKSVQTLKVRPSGLGCSHRDHAHIIWPIIMVRIIWAISVDGSRGTLDPWLGSFHICHESSIFFSDCSLFGSEVHLCVDPCKLHTMKWLRRLESAADHAQKILYGPRC